MSYHMKYEYKDELGKDVLHLPLFSMYTRKYFQTYYQYEGCKRGGGGGGKHGMKMIIKKTKAMVVCKKKIHSK